MKRVALTIRGIIPVWLLVVLIARDVVLLAFGPVLLRLGYGIDRGLWLSVYQTPRGTRQGRRRSCR